MKLDRTDRKILIAVFVMLGVLVVVATFAPQQEEEGRDQVPTSYSTSSGGAKAAYLLLEQLGYNVERWEQPPSALPSPGEGYTLVLLTPTQMASEADRKALQSFLASGGRVLSDIWGGYLLSRNETVSAFGGGSWQKFGPLAPSSLNAGARPISMNAAYRWSPQDTDVLPAYGDSLGAVVVRYRVGAGQGQAAPAGTEQERAGKVGTSPPPANSEEDEEGEVIWWASATPLTNAGLREEGNLELLLNSLGDKDSTHVLWDEYFHGSRSGSHSLIAGTPVPWGLLQVAVLMLAGVLTFSRRSGPIHDYQDPPRLSPLEFVYTLGNLYRRAKGSEVAVQAALQRFRLLLARRLGIQPQATPEQMFAALETRFDFHDKDFVNVMRGAERAAKSANVEPKDALALVQKLQQYSIDLKLIPTHGDLP